MNIIDINVCIPAAAVTLFDIGNGMNTIKYTAGKACGAAFNIGSESTYNQSTCNVGSGGGSTFKPATTLVQCTANSVCL